MTDATKSPPQPSSVDTAFVANFFELDEHTVQQLPDSLSHKLASQAQKFELLKSEKMMAEVNFGEYERAGRTNVLSVLKGTTC